MSMSAPQAENAAAAAGDPLAGLAPLLFMGLGSDGVYARTALYERVFARLVDLVDRLRDPRAEVLRFPPVMSRRQLEKSGYLKSFPNLLGCVCVLHGSEAAIRSAADRHESGGDWTTSLGAADLVLTPAACYPLYPLVAARGALPSGGLIFDVAADCFRREPSRSLDRLQTFRMREFVRIGTPDQVIAFRQRWMERAPEIADLLGLQYKTETASDPFFGRAGKLMAINQVEQALKFELLIPVRSAQQPTACMSFNYHQNHFGKTWDLKAASGEVAHTGCVAFGIDRLTLALFAAHGLDLRKWPASAREALAL
jgi:seryl-tRNA synthetase